MNGQIEERCRHEAITGTGRSVHEDCTECVEFYHGCNAQPEGKPPGFYRAHCADYYRLPDVQPGTYKQPPFPLSRMGARKEPRARAGSAAERAKPEPRQPATPRCPPKQPRRPSPAANYGLGGERLCECGVKLPKRKRCCDNCRLRRREQTLHRRRSQERPLAAVDAA